MFHVTVRYNGYGSYLPVVDTARIAWAVDRGQVVERKGRRGLITLHLFGLAPSWSGTVFAAGSWNALWQHGILLQADAAPAAAPSTDFLAILGHSGYIPLAVMAVLLCFSLLSFTVIFAKFGALRRATTTNRQFLRAFRKSPRLDATAAIVEQYRASPLATMFQFGYSEVHRQVTARSMVTNWIALERSMQLGISEEISLLEKNMIWLATTAAVCPFIGLFGTVLGIIDAFASLNMAGGTSMRAVAPGIAEALYTTALGLFAAIPAAIAYNYFNNSIKEIGQRMEDFALEFISVTERNFEGR